MRSVSRRDAFLILLGASATYIWTAILVPPRHSSIVINNQLSVDQSESEFDEDTLPSFPPPPLALPHASHDQVLAGDNGQTPLLYIDPLLGPPTALTSLPHTSIVAHAPGWTLFRNLYMSNGTLYIVSPSNDTFPHIRMMTSPGYPAQNNKEDIARREPTPEHMDFLTPDQANHLWKKAGSEGAYRVWSVKGNTILFNDPSQFLKHYYHFVAELFFGTWAFWYGAFTKPSTPLSKLSLSVSISDAPLPPPIHRVIFAHSDVNGWHDGPGFDSYFLRAVFPSLTVEDQRSWEDRIQVTKPRSSDPTSQRAWHFPLVLFTDRSAAHRGVVCGSETQRTAAEAWQYMVIKGKLLGAHAARWWDPVREAMWKFAGVETPDAVNWMKQTFKHDRVTEDDGELTPALIRQGAYQNLLPPPETITITYISRQSSRHRKLIPENHEELVRSVNALVEKRNAKGERWAFKIFEAEKYSTDEQIRIASNTTIMFGVHGNGLTHFVFMPPTRVSTVIEIFYPEGFAHDYQWTSTAMGMKYFGVWNDTSFTLPAEPHVRYPPGFQENSIPVHGPSFAKLIEDRVDGKI